MTDLKSNSEIATDVSGTRRVRMVGFAGFVLASIVAALWNGDRLRDSVFDAYQRQMPRAVEKFPARIVEIDEASLAEYGPWPWPRLRLARLAEGIFARGALAIGFDMIFPEPDRNSGSQFAKTFPNLPQGMVGALSALPEPDRKFAETIARLPVVLGRAGVIEDGFAGVRNAAGIPVEASFTGDPPPSGLLSFPTAITNLPLLDENAAGHAALNGPPDSDGILRRVPLVVSIGGKPTPTLALELLRVATNADGFSLHASPSELIAVIIGDRRIPTQPDGRLRLHFSPPLAARAISATAILDNSLAKDAFRGSVVIIGATSLGLEDVIATPIVSESFGVDVHAQLVETILAGNWLHRPDWAPVAEFALSLVLSLAAIALLPLLPPVLIIVSGAAGVLIVTAASFVAFAEKGLLLDPLTPSFVGGVTTLAVLCMMFVESDRRRRILRAALIEERVLAAHVAGELEAAREIQMGMLPSPECLAALPREIDLATVLESAQSVGGDLYDAFMVAEGKLFFMIGDVTGKGVPASLFMALSKALTKSALLRGDADFETAVMTANLEISRENSSELFVTGVLGLLDLDSGALALVNAGHDNPILLHAGDPPKELALEGGPPFCIIDDFPYPVESASLNRGDLLVLTTDGVTEARDRDGVLFGGERLMTALEKLEFPLTAQDTVSTVLQTVRTHENGGVASDDLTVMAIRYLGTEA